MWNLIRQNRLVDDREKIKVKNQSKKICLGACNAYGEVAYGQGIDRYEKECPLEAHSPQE